MRAELAVGVLLDVAQPLDVLEVEHRLAHLDAVGRVGVERIEQVRARADEAHQAHDELLADRVDRRVGDLREELLEVAVERLQLVGGDRQRAVVAHRAHGFLARHGHRAHQELEVFLGVAESLLQVEQRAAGGRRRRSGRLGVAGRVVVAAAGGLGRHDLRAGRGLGGSLRHGQVVDLDADALDPLAVGLGVGQRVFQFLVVNDSAGHRIDQEHLAWLQAPLFDDAALRDRQHARLGRHDDQIVVGDDVARRAQAVAVQRGADLAAVGERDRRRPVPRLHHGRVVLVEGAPVVVHQRVLLPRLRDHHHHGMGQRVAGHHQKLQRVVEGGRVGLARVDDRVELFEVGAQHGRLHGAFARAQPVVVALDRVDLAVVRDQPVRVRQRPLGKGVGREALVHQRQRAHHARILQVQVVLAHLVGQQQPLVDHGARRHRRHVVLLAVVQAQVLDGVAGDLADHVQLALERVGHHHVRAAADEDLADHRLLGAHGGRHRHVAVDRHVAPAQHHLALGAHGALELLLAGLARGVLLGQEHHAHAVLAMRRQLHALRGQLGTVERVRNLDQDAGAVAHQGIGSHGAAVIQVLQDQQALVDDVVRLAALDVGNEPDAAGIVLIGGVVQALCGGRGMRRGVHTAPFRREDATLIRCAAASNAIIRGQTPI